MSITHSNLRLSRSTLGEWMVEEWCYSSFKDAHDWGRPCTFKHKWSATRYFNQRLKELGLYERQHSALWSIIKEA